MEKTLFENKTVLVLGASGGIGSEICLDLALEGFHIIGVSIDEVGLKIVKREVEDVGVQFEYFVVDFKNRKEVVNLIEKIFEKFNGVDYIVNSLGIYRMGLFLDIPFTAYEDLINTDLRSLIYFYYKFLKKYELENKKELNQIIDVISWIQTKIYGGNAVAAASKSGVMTFSLDLAKEFDWCRKNNKKQKLSKIRLSRVYPENVDTTIYHEKDKNNPIWPIESFPKFSPSLVSKEVVNLIKNYKDINDVSITIKENKDVIVGLHKLNKLGTPNFENPEKEIDKGKVLDVHTKITSKGRGVFASKDFKKGEVVLLSNGKILSYQTEHSIQIDWDKHLEPNAPVRFINHSCEPNLGVKTDKETKYPIFVAFKDIKKDEELVFDYAMTEYKHYQRDNPKKEFNLSCNCGSKNCRKKLGYYSELSNDFKEKYKTFVSDYLVN